MRLHSQEHLRMTILGFPGFWRPDARKRIAVRKPRHSGACIRYIAEAWLKLYDTNADGNAGFFLWRGVPHSSANQGEHIVKYAVSILMGAAMVWVCAAGGEEIPPQYQEGPHPIQGLESFMERHGEKPYDLFEQEDGSLAMHRVIFEDMQFGTPVWMVDDSPTVDHAGTASIWWAWSINGSALYLEGTREIGGESHRGWFCEGDFSRMWPAQGGRPAVWAPEDPDVYYAPASPSDRVTRNNWRTGDVTPVAEWEVLSWPASGQRIYGLTTDERHIFVDLPNRGIFVPFTHDEDYPIPRLPLYDGRPIGPGGESVGSNHFCVIYDHDELGDLIGLRTGMLVDRQTGETTYIAAPLCGNTNYLRAFYENRVQYPEGEEWNEYGLPWFVDGVELPAGLDMDELHALWRNIPHVTHGHESPSPDWEYIATDGGNTVIAHVRSGETESIRLSPDGGNYHLHWRIHPRFFVGWVRGWQWRSYARPENGNIVYQVYSDLTAQPVFDTNHRFNGYYSGGDFSMQSPDATKIHTASSMTGRFRNYVAVMARPRPPVGLSWQAQNGGVTLSWAPSAYSSETLGYQVYRSETSGSGYQLLTPSPVEATAWSDASVETGTPYYYVVTAVEHSGIESGYSMEVARAGVELSAELDTPLVVYAEAEGALWELDTGARPGLAVGADRRSASDWYYVYRHPEADTGAAVLEIEVPAAAEYHLWARVRSTDETAADWRFEIGGMTGEAGTDATEWTWVRVGDTAVALDGRVEMGLSTAASGAALDVIALATDAGFEPSGPRPENQTPPAQVTALAAENIRERINRLRWDAPDAGNLSHYQVYAAREPFEEPSQRFLIGSPNRPEFIDWGLRAGTTYHYAVTAVDRGGNESAPVFTSQATPARQTAPVMLELAFADSERTGDFEVSEAGGLRGSTYIVPESPETNQVAWTIDVPHTGKYYFWLRYLHRGSGRRGDATSQTIRASLNGERIATLGGGSTELHVPDSLIAKDHPLAPRLWTWAWPGDYNLEAVELPAGTHTLTLDNLNGQIRYDVLVITDEPSFCPDDGRLRQS